MNKVKPETAFFDILGYGLRLHQNECRSYYDVCVNMYTKLPKETKQFLLALTENERIDIISDLILAIHLKLDVPTLLPSLDKEKLAALLLTLDTVPQES